MGECIALRVLCDLTWRNHLHVWNLSDVAFGGEGGIRTLEAFRLTHFPGVLLRPLGHLTVLTHFQPGTLHAGIRLALRARGRD